MSSRPSIALLIFLSPIPSKALRPGRGRHGDVCIRDITTGVVVVVTTSRWTGNSIDSDVKDLSRWSGTGAKLYARARCSYMTSSSTLGSKVSTLESLFRGSYDADSEWNAACRATDSLGLCAIRCFVTGEGLLSRGDAIVGIRCSVADDTLFLRTMIPDLEGRTVESAVVYAVAVRFGIVRTEGLRLDGRVVGEGSSSTGVTDTAFEVLPSSHGSLLVVVPGASLVGRAGRLLEI